MASMLQKLGRGCDVTERNRRHEGYAGMSYLLFFLSLLASLVRKTEMSGDERNEREMHMECQLHGRIRMIDSK